MEECDTLLTAMTEGWHWQSSDEGTHHWIRVYSIADARINVLPFPSSPGDALLREAQILIG